MTDHNTLVILRHAKAESPGDGADAMRALALRGRTQAQQLGTLLANYGFSPQLVLCSTALRTKQTWEILSSGLELPEHARIIFADELYQANVSQVLALVNEHSQDATSALVVGHEPIVSMTADYLAHADSDPVARAQVRVGVPTASACILRAARPWSQWDRASATLETVLRPIA